MHLIRYRVIELQIFNCSVYENKNWKEYSLKELNIDSEIRYRKVNKHMYYYHHNAFTLFLLLLNGGYNPINFIKRACQDLDQETSS